MNKKILIYLTFIRLFGLLFSCEKDETKAVLLDNPIVPTIQSMPDLTLKRANGTNILTFVGTPVDPGFPASVTYYLEVCLKGNNFQNATVIMSDLQDLSFKISVSDLNGILLKKFPADQVSSLDFRIRSVLSLSSGTGSFVYNSATNSQNVTLYGLPRLDLIGSGLTQKIESPLGDGKYSGFVNLDITKPFTLKDPDANIVYGGSNGVLVTNGTALPYDSKDVNGWHKLVADTKALTYKLDLYKVGIIGSATVNSWNSPDTKMAYDANQGCWIITTDLQPSLDGGVMKCEFKFRLNDDWAWNLGGPLDKLVQNGANIIVTPGNYTIKLFINSDGSTGYCNLIKN